MAKSSNKIVTYFQEAIDEFRKVTWPTRQQTINLFIVVTIITLIITVFIAVLDWIFAGAYRVLI
jgi:preprotein translocase SecE subunit